METKKKDNKQVKPVLKTTLPVVALNEKEMSSVTGGRAVWGT